MRRKIITFLLITGFVASCNFSDEVLDLSGGYKYVDEGGGNKIIDAGSKYIPCKVTAYGYNDDFIIASQKPAPECFIGKDTNNYRNGKDATYYWLVVNKKNLCLGPLSKKDFKAARERYRVPESLKMTSTIIEKK